MPTDKQIEAAAASDAKFDGRGDLLAMGRIERQRYLDRARAALTAAEQAQEAQPVGWIFEHHEFGAVWKRNFILNRPDGRAKPPASYHGSPVRNVRPLYTSPTIPEGWQIVPIEPTEEMIGATVDDVFDGAIEDASIISEVYRAMLAAAPKLK